MICMICTLCAHKYAEDCERFYTPDANDFCLLFMREIGADDELNESECMAMEAQMKLLREQNG